MTDVGIIALLILRNSVTFASLYASAVIKNG